MERMDAITLAARGVHKTYGATTALRAVDLEVHAGDIHGLVGANGAGKSTLVKAFSGVTRPDSGTICIGEWEGPHLTPRLSQELGLAVIYQEASCVPTLGLVENVMLGRLAVRGGLISRRANREASRESLERVGLDVRDERPAGTLKPADQQLLEIAKALNRRARVLIMDEPTAALGSTEARRLFEVVRALRADGVGMLFISHRLEDVLAICDRVTVMRDGGNVETLDIAVADESRLVRLMIGHELVTRSARQANRRGERVLELRGIGQGTRLRDINLTLHKREIVGVTGLVGSGRSRLARVIFGAAPFDAGEMTLDGKPFRPRDPAQAIRCGVGLVPEDRKADALLLDQSASVNITLAHMTTRLGGLLNLARESAVSGELMRRLRVKPTDPRAHPRTMSGGNQQKVSIARWLQARARVLILDEPGQGVDVDAKDQIFAVLRELASEGYAILVISQEIEELQQVADRAIVMRRGAIAGELATENITEERVIELAMGARVDDIVQGVSA